MTDVDFPDALPAGHRLHWYVLDRVLGQGGFGITYLAHDSNLDRPVAIKEYLPTEIARRRDDASARPHTEAQAERYAWGLERFLSEARTLARFDHPNIVRVLSVFEANNTAYMVMRFEEGEDLATLLERRGTLTDRQLTECLLPILDGLELVHAAGFIHRDIKPENIYVRKDGSPVLLDFGSARQSFGSAKTMTILVAPGYAPLEQYYGDAATQGPWTDIYGLGATCYRAIAGVAPLDAVARAKGVLGSAREILQPAVIAGRGRYGERLLEAVDHALKLSERDRPQSIVEWRHEIVGTAAAANTASSGESEPVALRAAPMPPRTRRLWLGGAALCSLAAIVFYLLPGRRTEPTPTATLAQAPRASDAAPTLAPPTVAAQVAVVEPPAVIGSAPKVGPEAVVARLSPTVRSGPRAPASSAPKIPAQSLPRMQASAEPVSTKATPESSTAPTPSALAASSVVATALPSATQVSRTGSPARSARDEQIDAGETALRRGDSANAVQLLAPWAAAGVPRAQALLGRAQEARSGGQQNFEAYVWYGIAARGGLSDAQVLRDKVAAKLQPAEIRQAEQIIDHFKPRDEPTSTSERASP